jgi:hypothetical protein
VGQEVPHSGVEHRNQLDREQKDPRAEKKSRKEISVDPK